MALIKFLTDHHGYREGQEVEMGNGVADIYVTQRFAVYVEAQKATDEKTTIKTRDIPGPKDPRSNR